MHTTRIEAQRSYETALAAVRAAESGTNEAAWMAAEAILTAARRALIEAEQNHPTTKEAKRSANLLRLRNRGYDC